MAVEMPARVEPLPGAVVAEFPWAAADRALRAFDAASVHLRAHLGDRAVMIDMVADWAGSYREEFDAASRRLAGAAGLLTDSLAGGAAAIVRGAELANQRQRQNNARAEDERALGRPGGRMAI